MSQLIHAVARVRAMESELLTQNSANRMISASSFEAAYSVLDDLGYAKESSIFRDSYNYEGAIEAGLFQTSQLFKRFEIASVQKILTVVFDIQNIILYLKALDKLAGQNQEQEELEELVDDESFISYAYYSKETLNNAFIHNKINSDDKDLELLLEKLNTCETITEKEDIVSRELFSFARKEAKKDAFLLAFLNKVELAQELKKEILVDSKEALLEKYNDNSEVKKILNTIFFHTSLNEQVFSLEILLDEEMVSFLKKSSRGMINGYEVLFSFFWRKERNSRVIRSILLAKKSGLSPESIKAEFSSFIF